MNRREMLLATGSAIAGTFAVNIDDKYVLNKFRIIDERLSNKITFDEMEEYECGWISDQTILVSKLDKELYFGMSRALDANTISCCEDKKGRIGTWIGKHNKMFYIKPSELAIISGLPLCMTAIAELVVPRSIPIILLINIYPSYLINGLTFSNASVVN